MTSAKRKFVRVFESVFPDLKRRRHIDGDQAVEVHPSRRAAMTVVAFASCILATAHLGVQTTAFAPQAFFRRQVKSNAVGKAFSSTLSAGPVASDAAAYATTSEPELCRVSVLLCPAQFCVPVDYDALFYDLREAEIDGIEIGSCRVAELPRTEWIKVARQLPTKAFFDANLPVRKTLDWYFDGMESALAEIFAEEGPDTNICVIGHSIGGWVARAFLGGMAGKATATGRLAQKQITSFITLGTPHSSPESALVDQTRGLIRAVETTDSCSATSLAERGIKVTCVGSSGLSSSFFSTDVEEIVAASSYFPLLGSFGKNVKGDGIVPTDLAFMPEPARRVEVENCKLTGEPIRHAHVLPTPWNLIDGSAASIALPDDFIWYGSAGVIEEWSKYIR